MLNSRSLTSDLNQYIQTDRLVKLDESGIYKVCESIEMTTAMQANSDFFGHPVWAKQYFETDHRSEIFRSRWHAATGSWDGKVVVDIGCGPGNFYATVGGEPQVLIGVDISYNALQMAKQVGYTPLWADAQNLPLIDGFADLVVANATLHHCDDMAKVLTEAARILKPGGLLLTDLDPQVSAMHFKGLAAFLRKNRFVLYRAIKSPYYRSDEWRMARIPTEAHNQEPGDGITPELYAQVLDPLGLEYKLYPHNHDVGAAVLTGNRGKLPIRLRILQKMSGIDPQTPEGAQSIMCIARKPSAEQSPPPPTI
jgi:SAM-dependent methyltransferase